MKSSAPAKKKVYVGLSGGVDSSVSAALLQKAGYDVTGVFIKVWTPDWLPCTWREDRRDAMRVCAMLGIPFKTLNLEEEYKRGVVDYMLSEYKAGRIPNPDVMCNKEIKFGAFYDWARREGADFIATGHYAQIEKEESHSVLKKGNDPHKDQVYFVWNIREEQLPHILFPVGHLQKSDVRKLAATFKLPTALKKDSQGLCFLGKVDMKDFLKHYIPVKPGNVIDENGKVIGKHDGAIFYTIGERHGFTITEKTPHDQPYYVIAKDIENNTISVSQKMKANDDLRNASGIELGAVHWVSDQPEALKKYTCQIRYRQDVQECHIASRPSQDPSVIAIIFSKPQAGIAPGQSLVLYDDDTCLGGGIIDRVEK